MWVSYRIGRQAANELVRIKRLSRIRLTPLNLQSRVRNRRAEMFDWLRRLVGGSQATEGDTNLRTEEHAINDYGAIIADAPLTIFPASRLPLPKQDMKAALKRAWSGIDDPHIRDVIEVGYIHLAHFRSEVSDPIDPTLAGPPDPARAMAILGPYREISGAMNAESAELLAEFRQFKKTCRNGDHR
jgi:hypothetical protein